MIIEGFENGKELLKNRKLFLVCGNSFERLEFADYIIGLEPVRFGNFKPNPSYEDVIDGVEAFNNSDCDTILAVGGGSAIDVAKSIKFYSKSSAEIIAIPTTSGTGSESTHFAVIYRDGVKQSIADQSLLPKYVILEASTLLSVPMYTRKATMLDALCHSIESYWAKKATDESRDLAVRAIKVILESKDSYLRNEETGNARMLKAANLAGQAINITTTTAAHAMSYKITSLYGLSHGHAVAICMPEVWRINDVEVPEITLGEYLEILHSLKLISPVSNNWKTDIDILSASVNVDRLKNNPVELKKSEIVKMYERIIHEG